MKSLVLYLLILFLITYVYDFLFLIPILNKYQVNNVFKNPSYPLTVVVLGVIRMFFPLIVAYLVFFIFIRKNFKEFFFYRRIKPKDFMYSLFSILLFFLIYYSLVLVLVMVFDLKSEIFLGSVFLVPLAILINFFATFGEETGWRGFLYRELSKYTDNLVILSIVIGIIWAFWHFPLILFTGFNYYNHRILGCLLFMVFCSGFTYLMLLNLERSRSLLSTIVMHDMFNSLGSIEFLIFPGSLYYVVFSPVGLLGIFSMLLTILIVRKCIS